MANKLKLIFLFVVCLYGFALLLAWFSYQDIPPEAGPRLFTIYPAACINGTQVTFLIQNVGIYEQKTKNVNAVDMSDNSLKVLTFHFLNGTGEAPAGYVLKPGETVRAKITSPCTTGGNPKNCSYELSLTGYNWKQELSVTCSG